MYQSTEHQLIEYRKLFLPFHPFVPVFLDPLVFPLFQVDQRHHRNQVDHLQKIIKQEREKRKKEREKKEKKRRKIE